ncbi:MAG: TonB-dependent receptor [Pseudomonadales bacterium]|nr:TonB-dependent receptor [Pseudomonadales bacterium]
MNVLNMNFPKTKLSIAMSAITASALAVSTFSALAEEDSSLVIEEIIVSASRRSEGVMSIPINVAALTGDEIVEKRLHGLTEIARYVPGLTVTDNGPRDDSPNILVRGLNTDSLGPAFDADLVATYLGDIPLEIDLKPHDMERVEVLIGPQGTLYGAATMGGAIRYIPNRADASAFSLDVRGSTSSMAKSSGLGTDIGVTINIPLIPDTLAVRAVVDQLNDQGFIDYNYVVRDPGVSDPNPATADRDANLRSKKDANSEDTLSTRINLRFTPTEWLDASVWYYFQDTKTDGHQLNGVVSFDTGKYEAPFRFEEPNNYENELISLDVKVDMGFAEATIIYGETTYEELGQRDQTDLLLDFEYGYEFMPSFAAFTREIVKEETKTWEVRLVSQYESRFNWVLGFYDNKFESESSSEEFTPGFSQFAIDNFGGLQLRPDELEYIQLDTENEKEQAFYGEVSFDITDSLTITAGYRDYEFDVDTAGGFGLPLFDTVFLGAPQDLIDVNIGENKAKESGDLFKFNVAWDANDDTLIYVTYSEGYRNGGVNSVPECTPEQIASDTQQLCALANEVLIRSDTIENLELGVKATFLDGQLAATAAIYTIDWKDLQVSDTTEKGGLPIIANGSTARSRGLELGAHWLINGSWAASLTYAYTDAELTDDAPGIVGPLTAPDGTRLPGSPKHAGSLDITYTTMVLDGIDLDVNYGLTYTGNIFNIPGGDEEASLASRFGESIDSYTLHHLSATFRKDAWSVQAFVDNLLDKYYVAGTRSTRRLIAENRGLINDRRIRSYSQYVGTPRNIGIRVGYSL